MVFFRCPNCRRQYQGKGVRNATRRPCPSCGTPLQVTEAKGPARVVAVGADSPAPAKTAAAPVSPSRKSFSLRDLAETPAARPKTTDAVKEYIKFQCQHCSATIKGRANLAGALVICPKCSEETLVAPLPELPPVPPTLPQTPNRIKQEQSRRQSQQLAEGLAKRAAEEQAQREAEEEAKRAAEAQAKREAEEKARREAEEKARLEAEEQAKREAEAKARQAAEEEAQREAEEEAKRASEEKARLEAEAQAQREAEEEAKREAEEQARRQAEEQTRREAEAKARQAAEEEAQREAEEEAKRAAEERARLEAEERAQREAEEEAKREAEEKARLEAEEQAKREAEAKARQAAEERAQREAEEEAKRAAEEKARLEAEEQAQCEAEEKAKREAEERAQREAEEKARRESEKSTRRAAQPAAQAKPKPRAPQPKAPQAPAALSPELQETLRCYELVLSGAVARDRLGIAVNRFLSQVLAKSVLGHEVRADIYAAVPFRYLALPSAASSAEIDSKASRLKAIARLRPEQAKKSFIRVGYDEHVSDPDALGALDQLKKDARQRLLWEVFWPHLNGGDFAALTRGQNFFPGDAFHALASRVKSADGSQHMLAQHALAVLLHNLAIVQELAFATGHTESTAGYWKNALGSWRKVIEAEEFWEYLGRRVEALDDPRLRLDDLAELRSELPRIILGFNRLFAIAYTSAGDEKSCRRHISIISKSGLDEGIRRDALVVTVRMLLASQLEPLVRAVENPRDTLAAMEEAPANSSSADTDWNQVAAASKAKRTGCCPRCDVRLASPNARRCWKCSADWSGESGSRSSPSSKSDDPNRFTRGEFQHAFGPILEQASQLRDDVIDNLGVPRDVAEQCEFDRLVEALVHSLNERMIYKDDAVRGLLYSIVVARQLLELPISSAQRRKLESHLRSEMESLYKGCHPIREDMTPGECYFMRGQIADPDESIELPVFKISGVERTYDGISCNFIHRMILVPRSRLAAAVHRGGAKASDLAEASNDPSMVKLRNRISKIQSNCAHQTAAVRQQCQREVEELNAGRDRRIAAYNLQIAHEEQANRTAYDEVMARCQQSISAEEERCAGELATVGAQHQPHIDQQESECKVDERAYRDFHQAYIFELPGGAISILVFAGMCMLAGWNVFIGLVAGAVVGLIGARVARGVMLRNVWEPHRQLLAARDDDLNACRMRSQTAIQQLEIKAEQEASNFKAKLDEYEAHRDQIRAEVREKTDAIELAAEQQAARLQADADQQKRPYEEQLAQSVRVRPEHEKKNFPLYRNALSNGFQEGRRPSDYDIQAAALRF